MTKSKSKAYTHALVRQITGIFGAILVFLGLIASYMAYEKEMTVMQSRLEQTMGEIKHAYESTTENFWRLYMPIVTDQENTYAVLRNYFLREEKTELPPIEKNELMNTLQTIMAFNHGIDWIGIYAGEGSTSYYLMEGERVLRSMGKDFPFWEQMQNKGAAMEVYGSAWLHNDEESVLTFALCGNADQSTSVGQILFGYRTDTIATAYARVESYEDVRFYITNEQGVVFDSTGLYDPGVLALSQETGTVVRQDGRWMKMYRLQDTGSKYSIFCLIPLQNAVLHGQTFAPYILAIVLLFLVSAMLMYQWTGRVIMRKIDAIQTGLHQIGENQLDYRIPVPESPTDEFESIGQSINDMTARLEENINKTYELRLKQKEAELGELQAKYDPHFLYNTLEVIRGKLYENGDEESAEVIIKMAKLFRGLINANSFVTVQEELDFCNDYLSLMEYRYDDRFEIIYDIDSDVMEYGIIRNLLQPVLENFFVHGIEENREKYTLMIRGKIQDEQSICFSIHNDGAAISQQRLESVRQSLEGVTGKRGYGLPGVHRRIRLFYGPDYGVTVKNNDSGGVTVEVKIKRLTCQEHQARLPETGDLR